MSIALKSKIDQEILSVYNSLEKIPAFLLQIDMLNLYALEGSFLLRNLGNLSGLKNRK